MEWNNSSQEKAGMTSNHSSKGLSVGLNKVHIVNKKEAVPRLMDSKGKTSKMLKYVI
ncbi:hypothetical protein SAY87_017347 [Trapa incisa]|uniref:Uncharacterized protein n=1 Tax=Trapa incisa TaxID=236973 RepID=A0AAN7L8E1_9MYRT|nr:hypothetical protein SAY87_017347 [Trapa incisa]